MNYIKKSEVSLTYLMALGLKESILAEEYEALPETQKEYYVQDISLPIEAGFIKRQIDQANEESPEDTLAGAIVDTRYGEEIHDKIKGFRVRIDSLHLTSKELGEVPLGAFKSRELSLAITDFQRARQFTGKMLQERGAEKPYTKEKTERPQQGSVIVSVLERDNYSEAIAELRQHTEEVIIDFAIYAENTQPTTLIETVACQEVLAGLLGGKMWLGELYAILVKEKS